jgi:phosphate-selective porin OprO/OprP
LRSVPHSAPKAGLSLGSPAVYRIVVQGVLDEELSDRVGGMSITVDRDEEGGATATLVGRLINQAQLLGVVFICLLAVGGPARSEDSSQPAEPAAGVVQAASGSQDEGAEESAADPVSDQDGEPAEDEAETEEGKKVHEGQAEEDKEIKREELQDLHEDAVPVKPEQPTRRQLLKPKRVTVRWDQGLRIERNDGLFHLKIGGRLEGDFAWIRGDEGIEEEIGGLGNFNEIRRAWVTLSGTVGRRGIYKVQVDVTGTSNRDDDRSEYLRETFLGIQGLGLLGTVRLGFHKEPFSMNELNSSVGIPFMERALPAAFVPSYNPGISTANSAFDRRITWMFGLYRFAGTEGSGHRLDLTGRITGLPIYRDEGRFLLHLGAGYSHQFRDRYSLRYARRPESHLAENFVDTGSFPVDGVNLYDLELAMVRGATTLQTELLLAQTDRPDASNGHFWGAYIQLTHMLTGEVRPYRRNNGLFGRIVPKHNLTTTGEGWGAFEIGARYSYLNLQDGEVRGGILNDVTLSLNWIPMPHVRFMTNYVHAHRNGLGGANIFQMRLGIDY